MNKNYTCAFLTPIATTHVITCFEAKMRIDVEFYWLMISTVVFYWLKMQKYKIAIKTFDSVHIIQK